MEEVIYWFVVRRIKPMMFSLTLIYAMNQSCHLMTHSPQHHFVLLHKKGVRRCLSIWHSWLEHSDWLGSTRFWNRLQEIKIQTLKRRGKYWIHVDISRGQFCSGERESKVFRNRFLDGRNWIYNALLGNSSVHSTSICELFNYISSTCFHNTALTTLNHFYIVHFSFYWIP